MSEGKVITIGLVLAILIVVAVAYLSRHDRENCEKAGGSYEYSVVWKRFKCEDGN